MRIIVLEYLLCVILYASQKIVREETLKGGLLIVDRTLSKNPLVLSHPEDPNARLDDLPLVFFYTPDY